jgi:hypothetical protein
LAPPGNTGKPGLLPLIDVLRTPSRPPLTDRR